VAIGSHETGASFQKAGVASLRMQINPLSGLKFQRKTVLGSGDFCNI